MPAIDAFAPGFKIFVAIFRVPGGGYGVRPPPRGCLPRFLSLALRLPAPLCRLMPMPNALMPSMRSNGVYGALMASYCRCHTVAIVMPCRCLAVACHSLRQCYGVLCRTYHACRAYGVYADAMALAWRLWCLYAVLWRLYAAIALLWRSMAFSWRFICGPMPLLAAIYGAMPLYAFLYRLPAAHGASIRFYTARASAFFL